MDVWSSPWADCSVDESVRHAASAETEDTNDDNPWLRDDTLHEQSQGELVDANGWHAASNAGIGSLVETPESTCWTAQDEPEYVKSDGRSITSVSLLKSEAVGVTPELSEEHLPYRFSADTSDTSVISPTFSRHVDEERIPSSRTSFAADLNDLVEHIADRGDEDFGDFEDETSPTDALKVETIVAGEQEEKQSTQNTQEPKTVATEDRIRNATAPPLSWKIDLGSIDQFAPVQFSEASDLSGEADDLSITMAARKLWYRLTRSETLHQSNSGHSNGYTRTTWKGSTVRQRTLEIVGGWSAQDRINGGVIFGGSVGRAMFGWDPSNVDSAGKAQAGLSQQSGRHGLKSLARDTPRSSLEPNPLKRRLVPTVPGPHFDWSSVPTEQQPADSPETVSVSKGLRQIETSITATAPSTLEQAPSTKPDSSVLDERFCAATEDSSHPESKGTKSPRTSSPEVWSRPSVKHVVTEEVMRIAEALPNLHYMLRR